MSTDPSQRTGDPASPSSESKEEAGLGARRPHVQHQEVRGGAASASITAPALDSAASAVLEVLVSEMRALRAEVAQVKEAQRAKERAAARRASIGILTQASPAPPSPTTRASVLTDSSLAAFRTPPSSAPAVAQARVRFAVDEDTQNAESDDEFTSRTAAAFASESESATPATKTKTSRLIKALTKIPAPSKFSGETEAEKDRVEDWVRKTNNWLDGQLGDEGTPKDRMRFIVNLLEGPAAQWLSSVYHEPEDTPEDEQITWAELQKPFIDFIRGGTESRVIWEQRMDELRMFHGNVPNLAKQEQEFELLRMRLYPTSSTDMTLNQVTGTLYRQAVQRGNLPLYAEMLRVLGPNDKPSLAECKRAAGLAYKITQSEKAARTSSGWQRGKLWSGQGRSWATASQSQGQQAAAVHHVNTQEGSDGQHEGEGGEEGQPSSSIQGMQSGGQGGAKKGGRTGGAPGPSMLTDAQFQQVMAEGRCFQCYQKGHRARDNACPEKGKSRRKPAPGELN